jgi:thioredoxin 1
MSSEVTITHDNFETEVLQSPIPVLVDFWAVWCGPCNMTNPVLEELAKEYAGRIKVAKINVDQEIALAERCGVSSIPTFILYNKGTIVRQKTGAMPKTQLEYFFKDLL